MDENLRMIADELDCLREKIVTDARAHKPPSKHLYRRFERLLERLKELGYVKEDDNEEQTGQSG